MKRAQCTGFIVNIPRRIRKANNEYTTFVKVLIDKQRTEPDEFVYVRLNGHWARNTNWFTFKARIYIEGWFKAYAYVKDNQAYAQDWINASFIEFLDTKNLKAQHAYIDLITNTP